MIEVDQSAGAPVRKHKFYQILYVQVLVAIVIGVLLGYFKPDLGEAMKPLGDGFIKLVKMIIAPVIFLTVTTGIAAMSDLKKVGRVAGKAMVYFLVFSTLALIIGMVVSHIVQPGAGLHIDPASLDQKSVAGYVTKAHDSTITGFLLNIIPATMLSPFVGGGHSAGLVRGGAIRSVAGHGWSACAAHHGLLQRLVGAGVQAGCHLDEGRAYWCLWRHGFHHWQVRYQVHRQPGDVGRYLLRHVGAVCGGRAGYGGTLQRLLHYQAGALHPRRTATGAGH